MSEQNASVTDNHANFLEKMNIRDMNFARDLEAANKPFGPGQVIFAVALGLLLLGVSGGIAFLLATLIH
jgi:hypothetical protein